MHITESIISHESADYLSFFPGSSLRSDYPTIGAKFVFYVICGRGDNLPDLFTHTYRARVYWGGAQRRTMIVRAAATDLIFHPRIPGLAPNKTHSLIAMITFSNSTNLNKCQGTTLPVFFIYKLRYIDYRIYDPMGTVPPVPILRQKVQSPLIEPEEE